jgi:hypothetical protein
MVNLLDTESSKSSSKKRDGEKKKLPHTEDLLAHEPNFDASGAHLGFYYPEDQDERERLGYDEDEHLANGGDFGRVAKPEV